MSSVALFFILAVVLLVIGVPVATTLGLSSVIFIILEGIPTSTVIQRMFAGVDVVALMCIPFFILAGDLMAKGGIAKRLVRVANLVVGNITGGLAYVYDADNNFDQKCNLGSVDLETVMPHSADEAELLQLIYEHYMATRSRRAYDLLNNWPEERGKFIKVFPVEYRHALAMHS